MNAALVSAYWTLERVPFAADSLAWLAGWIADYYLLATLLLAAVVIAGGIVRQPARRIAMAWAAALGLVLLAALSALPGWSAVHLLTRPERPAVVVESLAAETAPPITGPAPIVYQAPTNTPPADWAPASDQPVAPVTVMAEEIAEIDYGVLLAAALAAGTLLVAAWLAVGAWQTRQLLRSGEAAPGSVLGLLRAIAAPRPSPELKQFERLPTAAAVGLRRPTVLLPSRLAASADPAPLESVLAHEWAHIRGGDLWLLALVRLLLVALWAHPLFWLWRRRIRLDQETLADAAAAEIIGRLNYAQHLVAWAREVADSRPPRLATAVGLWEGKSQLRKRLAVLLDEKFTVLRTCTRRWRLATALACGAAAVGLSLVTLAPAEQAGEVLQARIDDAIRTLCDGEVKVVDADEWGDAVMTLVDIGEDSVPALIAALDNETRDLAIRRLAFTMRAIGDARAVPALIRALPRTFIQGDDLGKFKTADPILLKLLRDQGRVEDQWGFEELDRSFVEVAGALSSLTGQQFAYEELIYLIPVQSDGLYELELQKRCLYHRLADKWASWWESDWNDYVADVSYRAVDLQPLHDGVGRYSSSPFPTGPSVNLSGGYSGATIHPIGRGGFCFWDLDTGRQAKWPKELGPVDLNSSEMLAWAHREGFDLLGYEAIGPAGGTHNAVKMLGMQAWRIRKDELEVLSEAMTGRGEYPLHDAVDSLDPIELQSGAKFSRDKGARYMIKTSEGLTGLLSVAATPPGTAPEWQNGVVLAVSYFVDTAPKHSEVYADMEVSDGGPPQDASAIDTEAPPKFLSIGDKYIVCAVRTPLQRELLSDRNSVCVFVNAATAQELSDDRSEWSLEDKALASVLAKHAARDNRGVTFWLKNAPDPAPGGEQKDELMDRLTGPLEQLGKELGFAKAFYSHTFSGSFDWGEWVGDAKHLAGGDEAPVEDETLRVYGVQTPLSRLITGADCIAYVRPIVTKRRSEAFPTFVETSLKDLLPKFAGLKTEKLLVHVRPTEPGAEVLQGWLGGRVAREEAAQRIGFDEMNLQLSYLSAEQGAEAEQRDAEEAASAEAEGATGPDLAPKLGHNSASDAAPTTPIEAARKLVDLTFVIAEHSILFGGKEIVTWEGVERIIASLPDPTLARPHFYDTNAAARKGRTEEMGRQAQSLKKKYGFYGMSVGSVAPRAGARYDKIKSPEDLVRDESLRVEGRVVNAAGEPVAGAEVVLIARVDESVGYTGSHISLRDGQLATPIEEVVTRTNAAGRFALYPPRDEKYFVLVIHPEQGFGLLKSEELTAGEAAQLQPWAKVHVTLTPEEGPEQWISLSTRIAAEGYPELSLSQSVKPAPRSSQPVAEFSFLHTPPGHTTLVSRAVDMGEGVSRLIREAEVTVPPGESKQLDLGGREKEEASATPQVDTVDEAAPDAPMKALQEPIDLTFVVAEHAILFGGKEIVTWEGVERIIASLPDPTLAHPHFKVTNKAMALGRWDEMKERAYDMWKEYSFVGLGMGSVLPRAGVRYDKIEEPADLAPDESLRVEGRVVDTAGKPVAGAEVVLIAQVDEAAGYTGIDITLRDGRLRGPLDEVLTQTDADGRFAIYPPKEETYFVLAMHPQHGIRALKSEELTAGEAAQLQPWARVHLTLTPDDGPGQSMSLSNTITAKGYPEFQLSQNGEELPAEDRSAGQFSFLHVPPGHRTIIRRAIDMADGGSRHTPEAELNVPPGESKQLDLGTREEGKRRQAEFMEAEMDALRARANGGAEKETPPAGETEAEEGASAPSDAPEPDANAPDAEDDQPMLVALVVDSETEEPIGEFVALAGTSRMEDIGWQWQPHTIAEHKEGKLSWPPEGRRGYNEQVLRIEATGYKPYVTPVLRQGEEQRIVVRLERDPQVWVRVLTPDGEPAAGAEAAIAMAQREVRIVDGGLSVREAPAGASLRDQWETPFSATADESGAVALPTETGKAYVALAHEKGFAVALATELASGGEVRLEPWGTVQGRVMWGDKPGEGEKLFLGARTRLDEASLVLSLRTEVVADDEGRFTFAKVPPGLAQLSRAAQPEGHFNGESFFPIQFIEVNAGEPTEVVFGGKGRPVEGKLVGRDDWTGVTLSAAPNSPPAGFLMNREDPAWPAFQQFLASEPGKNYVKEVVAVAPDGSFRLENVPPERYQLFVQVPGADGNAENIGGANFQVKTLSGGEADEPLDIGEIRVR